VDFTQGLSIAALPPQERARALFALGVTLDSLGRLEDAVSDYSTVLRLASGATYVLNNRANVRRRQGRLDEAGRDYLAALTAACGAILRRSGASRSHLYSCARLGGGCGAGFESPP